MKKFLAGLSLSLALVGAQAHSAVIGYLYEEGDDVVWSYGGSLNTLGFVNTGNETTLRFLRDTDTATFLYNLDGGYSATRIKSVTKDSNTHDAALASGDIFTQAVGTAGAGSASLSIYSPDAGGGNVSISSSYVSGERLSGTLTIANKSLLDLGFSKDDHGTYSFGLHADTVSLIVGAAPILLFSARASVPQATLSQTSISETPLPAGLYLMLAGLGGLGYLRRRKGA